MPYHAKVTCPACRTQFQVPVEQILDVRVNPAFKNRLLSGAINVAVCPACGSAGSLNLPFIYHDPEKEIALLYLPVESGRTEVERQQLAGNLTRTLMDALPMEERKGYLLQPETFINMDTLIRRVLELEGVTEDDLTRNREQQEFLGELLKADREEWEQLLKEKGDCVDQAFMGLLDYTMNMLSSVGAEEEDLEKVGDLYDYLISHHPVAKDLYRRAEVVKPFLEDPSRESLLQALLEAPDEETVEMLVHSGLGFMDYGFFQQFVKKMEAAESDAEKARLTELRKRILELREEIMNASEDLAKARMDLLLKMLNSSDPLKMARSHLSELDEAFSYVLQEQIRQASQSGDQKYLEALNRLVAVIEGLLEEAMPPEVALARRLLMAPSDKQVDALLNRNKELLKDPFFKLLESLEQQSREQGETETSERLAQLLVQVRGFVASSDTGDDEMKSAPGSGEQTSPSGLIISTRK